MINHSQARKIADEHVLALEKPAAGYHYARGRILKVESGWYSDYNIVCETDIPDEQQERFAGAMGFVIDGASGEVTSVSHSEWVDLGLACHPDPYGTEVPDDEV